MLRWTVVVADNFHYHDESEHYTHQSFDTYEDALRACRTLVDQCLLELHKPGMSAERLYLHYTMFGEEPFIVPAGPDPRFSAWSYAKERASEICRTETPS